MTQNDINVKINVDASQAQKQTTDFRVQVRELTRQMTELQLAGKENSDEYKALARQLGVIKDAMGDTAAQARILSNDYYKQQAALEGLSVGINVFSGLTQAAALCGVENEDLQETLVKLQAAQNLANTAMNISKALNKDTALMTALNTVKTKILTTATNEQTTAQLALNAAKLGMIGIIAGAVTALGVLIVKYASAKNKVAEFNKELNKSAAEAVAPTITKINDLSEAWAALGDDLEAKKKFISDNKKEFDDLGQSVNSVEEAENLLVANTTAFIEAQELRAKAAAARKKQEELAQQQLEEQLEYERRFVDDSRTFMEEVALKPLEWIRGREKVSKEAEKIHKNEQDNLQKEIDRVNELSNAYSKEADEKLKSAGFKTPEEIAAEKKAEEARKKAEDAAKGAAEERKRQRAELNKFIEDGQKAELQREKELNKETHEGRLKNIEIEKEETTSLYDQKIADAEKLFGKDSEQVQQIKQLKENALTELQNKRLTEIQNELDAQKKAADEKKAANEKAQKESERAATDSALRIAKAEADARLIGLKEGSEEYNAALKEQYKVEYDIALEELNRQHEDKLISEEEYLAKLALLNAEYRQKEKDLDKQAAKATAEARLSAAEQMVSQIGSLTQSMMNAELEAVGDNEEEQAKIRKKYAKINFLSQIASIGIDTAKGIMSIWSTAGEAGLGAPAYGAAMTALIAATGIAQTAQAKAAMDKALSGKAARGAFINGRSHAQGGELWELEGGEAVLNKRAMAIPAFKQLASAMNESTGGVSFTSGISGVSSKPIISAGVSEETVQRIVSDTVAGIVSIPVTVTEHRITEAQRRVEVINSQASF